jgi:signal transduction histidine kinase
VQIVVTYIIGVCIALFNVFLTAQLMFISADHDLQLLVLLLLFAAVVSIGLGFALAAALAQRVIALGRGAQALAQGDLSVRVAQQGNDELAELARDFNRMAGELSIAAGERERQERARREFMAAISHDLRTPLTSLRVMTEALADGMIEDATTTSRYLSTMRGQIDHLATLIDDLYELAQIDAGALALQQQRVMPAEMVSDSVEAMLPQAAARGITLTADLAPDLPPVLVAPQKIERVLFNLLSNAIRHTPDGGSVTVRVKPLMEEAAAGPDAPHPVPCILFEVSDTGEGIDPDDRPRIFERFYRGEQSRSRATGGSGLGLAIARGIVEAHGGQIWAVPASTQGACIRFTIAGG